MYYYFSSQSTDDYEDEMGGYDTDSNCVLRRNTASGTATGLEVLVLKFDESQYLINRTSITGVSGVKVSILRCCMLYVSYR